MATAIISRGLGFVVASVTMDGTNAEPLNLGFVPAFAKAYNVTTTPQYWEWCSGFSGATGGTTAIHLVLATASNFGIFGAGVGGISPLIGSDSTGIGLRIGTNTTINNAGDAWIVTAWQGH